MSKVDEHKKFWRPFFPSTIIPDEYIPPLTISECKVGDIVRPWFVPNTEQRHLIIKITDKAAETVTKDRDGVVSFLLGYLVVVEGHREDLSSELFAAISEWQRIGRNIHAIAFS